MNFENFLRFIRVEEDNQRLTSLLSMVSLRVYENIQDETTYTTAIKVLKELYDQPVNRVHARLMLASRKQQPSESSRAYLQVLKGLGKDCNCVDKTAAEITSDLVRDAYVAGLRSNEVRLCLLEQGVEKLEDMVWISITMEDAALTPNELSRDWTTRSDVGRVPFYLPPPEILMAYRLLLHCPLRTQNVISAGGTSTAGPSPQQEKPGPRSALKRATLLQSVGLKWPPAHTVPHVKPNHHYPIQTLLPQSSRPMRARVPCTATPNVTEMPNPEGAAHPRNHGVGPPLAPVRNTRPSHGPDCGNRCCCCRHRHPRGRRCCCCLLPVCRCRRRC
ncbi:uncharacterized protein [Narcine bancroftii]|uniref:uncharacterized protein n=1 Tax=Narcine bancroftii TaxID=1343680 RepID=UPI003831BCAC